MAIIKTLRKLPDVYPITEVRVIDGDTIQARILLPFDQSVTKRIRLKGWWADEPVGLYAAAGSDAKLLLEKFCWGKALWLHAPSCRTDKYGRLVGHLMVGMEIVDPRAVLGALQLSERVHNEHRAASKSAGVDYQKAAKGLDGRYVPVAQSKCPSGHPEAITDTWLGTTHGNGHDEY